MNQQESTFTARILGYLGLVPFLVSSFLIWLPLFHRFAVDSLSIYAAVILTFIGGVHWGLAMQSFQDANRPKNNGNHNQFIFSIIPSLLAWVAIVFFKPFALILLALCFGLFWLVERSCYKQNLPSWYSQLRNHLTLIASLCIIIGWFGTL